MKKLFTFFAATIFCSSVNAQIPNGGFENWTATGVAVTPDGWDNLNQKTAAMSIYTCEKGTPGSPGSSYLRLTSKTVAGMGVMPGIAVSGILDTITYLPKSGFPYTTRPSSLSGSWQYMAFGSDQGYVSVLLSKWNIAAGKRDTVAFSIQALSGMAMAWANFTITLGYTSGQTPDSAIIVLSASGATPVSGSYLLVDNLAFSGTVPSGVTTIANNTSSFSVYPNPATGATTILYNSNSGSDIKVLISDLEGRNIISQRAITVIGENNIPVNISQLASGIYVISITDGQRTYNRKLVIE